MTERPDLPIYRIASDVVLGERVRLNAFINLYGCRIQSHTFIGSGALIGAGAVVLKDVAPGTTFAGGRARVVGRRP